MEHVGTPLGVVEHATIEPTKCRRIIAVAGSGAATAVILGLLKVSLRLGKYLLKLALREPADAVVFEGQMLY